MSIAFNNQYLLDDLVGDAIVGFDKISELYEEAASARKLQAVDLEQAAEAKKKAIDIRLDSASDCNGSRKKK